MSIEQHPKNRGSVNTVRTIERWMLLSRDIREIAAAAGTDELDGDSARRRVGRLVARECMALGADLPLTTQEAITGVFDAQAKS